MTAKKKRSARIPNSRDAILDATEEIMMTEGYAAVTSRRVASKAGLKSKLLHYYFRSMDDLFVATFQRLEHKYDKRFADAMAADDPVWEMWKLNFEAASTGLVMEFMALATHRPAVRVFLARSAKRDRAMHVSALARIMEGSRLRADDPSPGVIALLMASVARTLVTEKALGVTNTHAEMMAFVERHLSRIGSYRSRTASPRQLKIKRSYKSSVHDRPQKAIQKRRGNLGA